MNQWLELNTAASRPPHARASAHSVADIKTPWLTSHHIFTSTDVIRLGNQYVSMSKCKYHDLCFFLPFRVNDVKRRRSLTTGNAALIPAGDVIASLRREGRGGKIEEEKHAHRNTKRCQNRKNVIYLAKILSQKESISIHTIDRNY